MGLFDFVGDVIGAFSGHKQNKSAIKAQQSANEANILMQREANENNRLMQEQANRANLWIHNDTMARQENAARNSIQWRVADGIAAGLHPLYATGIQPISMGASGAFIGASSDVAPSVAALPAKSSFIGSMGQNISSAIQRSMTKEERAESNMMAAFNREREIYLGSEQMREAALRNDLLESQIRLNNDRTQIGPASPSIGAQSGAVIPEPARPVVGVKDYPGREAGVIQDYGWVRTPTGLKRAPSKDMKERIDDDFVGTVDWNIRNRLMPMFTGGNRPNVREFPLPRNMHWGWDPSAQEWRPVYNDGSNRGIRRFFRR